MHSISDEQIWELNTLTRTPSKFKETFSNLIDHKECYIKITKENRDARAMSGILNAVRVEEAISTFQNLLEEDKDLAFCTLDRIHPQSTLFNTLFGKLDKWKEEYIGHVKEKKGARAMFGILNAIGVEEATSTFQNLLKEDEDKDFAFRTLDNINPRYTLFQTLFGTLGATYKENYRQHLQKKKTKRAHDVLQRFYSDEASTTDLLESTINTTIIYPHNTQQQVATQEQFLQQGARSKKEIQIIHSLIAEYLILGNENQIVDEKGNNVLHIIVEDLAEYVREKCDNVDQMIKIYSYVFNAITQLELGEALLNIKNHSGRTPLELAKSYNLNLQQVVVSEEEFDKILIIVKENISNYNYFRIKENYEEENDNSIDPLIVNDLLIVKNFFEQYGKTISDVLPYELEEINLEQPAAKRMRVS